MQRDGCEKRTQKNLPRSILPDLILPGPICTLSENLEIRDLAGSLAVVMSKIHNCGDMPDSKELDSTLHNFRLLFERIEKSHEAFKSLRIQSTTDLDEGMAVVGKNPRDFNTGASQILTRRMFPDPIEVTVSNTLPDDPPISFATDYRKRHVSRSERRVPYGLHREYHCNPRKSNPTNQVITRMHDQHEHSLSVRLFNIDKPANNYQDRTSLSKACWTESKGNLHSPSYQKPNHEITSNTVLPSIYQQLSFSQTGAPLTYFSQKDLRITELDSQAQLSLASNFRSTRIQGVNEYASFQLLFLPQSLPEMSSLSRLGLLDRKRPQPLLPHLPSQQIDRMKLPGNFGRQIHSPTRVYADQKTSGSTKGNVGCTYRAFDNRPVSKYIKRSRAPGPKNCILCRADSTPEWRRGPHGPRTLCNACGLFYAKTPRKKKRAQGNDTASVSLKN